MVIVEPQREPITRARGGGDRLGKIFPLSGRRTPPRREQGEFRTSEESPRLHNGAKRNAQSPVARLEVNQVR